VVNQNSLSEETFPASFYVNSYFPPGFLDKTLIQEGQCILEQWYFLKLENETTGLLKDYKWIFHFRTDDKHRSVHK
jgi:hypothetical protein